MFNQEAEQGNITTLPTLSEDFITNMQNQFTTDFSSELINENSLARFHAIESFDDDFTPFAKGKKHDFALEKGCAPKDSKDPNEQAFQHFEIYATSNLKEATDDKIHKDVLVPYAMYGSNNYFLVRLTAENPFYSFKLAPDCKSVYFTQVAAFEHRKLQV